MYYGARYYNPRESVWLSPDPLWEGVYIEGLHNGGVYNSGNLALYSYTYNNPVTYIDPNGKQSVAADYWTGVKKSFTAKYESAKEKIAEYRANPSQILVDTKNSAIDGAVMLFDGITAPVQDLINEAGYETASWQRTTALHNAIEDQVMDVVNNPTPEKLGEVSGNLVMSAAVALITKKIKKPCGCFTAETTVLTEDGFKNIEDIAIGDSVWAYNDKTGELALKRVINTFTRDFSQIYKIYYGNEVLEVTHEHPFFIGNKWLKSEELKVGDLLTLQNGLTKQIEKIEFVSKGDFKVYNFTVEGFHTYYVSGEKVLVHNGSPCRLHQLKHSKFGIKIGDKIPDGVPKNWSKGDIEDAISDYKVSVGSRKKEAEFFRTSGKGNKHQAKSHNVRIRQEENFIKALEKELDNRK